MSDSRQASASSNRSCSTRSSLLRPMPKEITRATSLMMAPTLSSMAANGVSSRTAMLPQPISKPTPEMLICFS
jgi:hypothetical protein